MLVLLGSHLPEEQMRRARIAAGALRVEGPYDLVIAAGHNGECLNAIRLARQCGMPRTQRVLYEPDSSNTNENAFRVFELVQNRQFRETTGWEFHPARDLVRLATSPWHNPRALLTFRSYFAKVGTCWMGKPWIFDTQEEIQFKHELGGIVDYGRKGLIYPFSEYDEEQAQLFQEDEDELDPNPIDLLLPTFAELLDPMWYRDMAEPDLVLPTEEGVQQKLHRREPVQSIYASA